MALVSCPDIAIGALGCGAVALVTLLDSRRVGGSGGIVDTRRAAGTTETLLAVGLGGALTPFGGREERVAAMGGRLDDFSAAGARLVLCGGAVVRRCGADELGLCAGGAVFLAGGGAGRASALCSTARFTNSLEAADIRLYLTTSPAGRVCEAPKCLTAIPSATTSE